MRWVQLNWSKYFIVLVDDTYDVDSFKAKRFVPATLLDKLLKITDSAMTDKIGDTDQDAMSIYKFARGYQNKYQKHMYE